MVSVEQDYYIIAHDLVEDVFNKFEVKFEIVASFSGISLNGFYFDHPIISNKRVPLLFADYVDLSLGTGLVHTAPMHGVDDYLLGKVNNLPMNDFLSSAGVFISDELPPSLLGLHIWKSTEAIVSYIGNHILFRETIEHSYPHCWRHNTPVITKATLQWFIVVDKVISGQSLRDCATSCINEIDFIPANGRNRLSTMIANRPDWCIFKTTKVVYSYSDIYS